MEVGHGRQAEDKVAKCANRGRGQVSADGRAAGKSFHSEPGHPGGERVRVGIEFEPKTSSPFPPSAPAKMLNYGESPSGPPRHVTASRRRTTASDHGRFTCSQQSVLSAIDRFVRSVNSMDATVLVPSRLKDMEVTNRRKATTPPPGLQHHQDLYSFYTMLKDVKNELLWGPSSVNATLFPVVGMSSLGSAMSSPRRSMVMPPGMTTGMTTPRQASDDGLGSSMGCSSDQDTDSDFESIMTDRESMIMEQTSHLATAFRHHLHGLHAILHQLADSADYLASRYQEEIDSPMG